MQNEKSQLLRNVKTGRVFRYSPILAKRHDMELLKQQENRPAQPEAGDAKSSTESDEFVVSKADKDQLVAFALAEFDVKLDKRKALADLRAEVMELAGATD